MIAGPPTWPYLSLDTLAGHKASPIIRFPDRPGGSLGVALPAIDQVAIRV